MRVQEVRVHEPGLRRGRQIPDQRVDPTLVAPVRRLLPPLNLRVGVDRVPQPEQVPDALVESLGDSSPEHVGFVARGGALDAIEILPAVVRRIEAEQVGVFRVGIVTHAELQARVAFPFQQPRQMAMRSVALQCRRWKGDVGRERQPAREQCHQ